MKMNPRTQPTGVKAVVIHDAASAAINAMRPIAVLVGAILLSIIGGAQAPAQEGRDLPSYTQPLSNDEIGASARDIAKLLEKSLPFTDEDGEIFDGVSVARHSAIDMPIILFHVVVPANIKDPVGADFLDCSHQTVKMLLDGGILVGKVFRSQKGKPMGDIYYGPWDCESGGED